MVPLLQLVLEQKHDGKIVKSKLSLVDLAGSERWDEKDTSSGIAAGIICICLCLHPLAD